MHCIPADYISLFSSMPPTHPCALRKHKQNKQTRSDYICLWLHQDVFVLCSVCFLDPHMFTCIIDMHRERERESSEMTITKILATFWISFWKPDRQVGTCGMYECQSGVWDISFLLCLPQHISFATFNSLPNSFFDLGYGSVLYQASAAFLILHPSFDSHTSFSSLSRPLPLVSHSSGLFLESADTNSSSKQFP